MGRPGREAIGGANSDSMASQPGNRGIDWSPMRSAPSIHRLSGDRLLRNRLFREAEESYRQALADHPEDADAMVGLARCLRQRAVPTDVNAPRHWIERALRVDPSHVAAWLEQGHTLVAFGTRAEAATAYARVLELDPGHAEARYYLSLCTGNTPDLIPESLVADLFDGYADTFDDHLRHGLRYDVPRRLRLAVDSVRESRGTGPVAWSVADLGCGTGLSGREFRDLAARLVGIDLSSRMIERARELGIYDELHVGGLVACLNDPQAFDLLVAADVLVYLGDLRPVFAAASRSLRDGGLFAFTTEAAMFDAVSPDTCFVHTEAGRFGHARPYIEESARSAGFAIALYRSVEGRREEDRPVGCHLHVLAKDP